MTGGSAAAGVVAEGGASASQGVLAAVSCARTIPISCGQAVTSGRRVGVTLSKYQLTLWCATAMRIPVPASLAQDRWRRQSRRGGGGPRLGGSAPNPRWLTG